LFKTALMIRTGLLSLMFYVLRFPAKVRRKNRINCSL
jgi:hypothetical protein